MIQRSVEANQAIGELEQKSTTLGLSRLLIGGMAAGPFYLIVGLAQAFTRPGFDITRHDLSLLSNGTFGWVQIGNFLITGTLVLMCAVGIKRVLRSGVGSRWLPLLVGAYGVGLIGAGLFSADPASGFPPGTPAAAHSVSWHGMLHLVCGGLGFLSLIAGCFVYARRSAKLHQRKWAVYSRIAGVAFLAGFVGIASGSGNSWTVLGFWIGLIVVFGWLFALSRRLLNTVASEAVV